MNQKASINLLGLPRHRLEPFFAEQGEKAFRASQIMKWVHQHGITDFQKMTNLSRVLRNRLQDECEILVPSLLTEQRSADGTRKWVLRLSDDNAIETVFIPEAGRGTLCVSSQVGCALDCTFCSTARQGFNRNLSPAEIVAQLWYAQRVLIDHQQGPRVITNVVFMGMGEPLLNFENTVDAISLMMDDHAYGLGKRKVTVSTSGVIPAMDRLKDRIDVSLAVSLHAPNDELRDRLVPLNRKYPIKDLLAACKRFVRGKNRKHTITFEYVMLADVNDSQFHARALAKLLQDVPSKVNLIPFNPFPKTPYRRSEDSVIDRFAAVLQQRGITTITRRTRGGDIDAACGQLVGKVLDRSRRQRRFMRLERDVPVQNRPTP
ncbi:MAG: 23S rRNA (adenine(2503)-C(2))-methyltransferase RlmN [Gammaproteobacteria bacterium]|nr:23S rRNA (adenine(2503)-C(2))-methyltransferase RlmN [Gammaproteobacteria bacterium]